MKKILSIILTLCMCLTMGAVLTACNFGTTDPGHTHTYEAVWSYDDTYHWYACEDNTCTETSQKAEHSIENGICSVCGYEQSAPTPPPTPSTNKVTEEQFNAAFSFEGVTGVTIRSESNASIVNGVQQGVYYSTTYLDGNKIKMISDNTTTYAEIFDTYVYVYTLDTTDNTWIRYTIESENAAGLMTLASLTEMFDGADFSDFTFEDGYYIGSQTFEEGTANEYVVNFKFQFENGKLISARGEYEVEGFDCYDYMTFTDYNSTTVNVPTEYRENEDEPTPPVTSSWTSYFEFDNVTVKKTSSTYYSDLDITISNMEKMKVQGNKWLWETTDYYYGDALYENFVVYFDGTDAYIYGVIDNQLNTQNTVFFLNADFSAYEGSFTETSSGVFEANEISAYGVYTYKDVRITVVNERISSMEYTMDIAVGGATYTQTISYLFTSWGETTVDGDEYTEPSAWRSYFDFDNVTITETKTYDINGTPQPSELGTVWKIVGDKWLCIQDATSVDGTVVVQHIAYFDGINSYLTNFDMTGALVESVISYHYTSEYLMSNLPTLEEHFEKTKQGNRIIYSANSIVLYDLFTYTNIKVIVENNRIVSIEYSVSNMLEVDGKMYPGTYLYEFSAYGATTIDYIVPDHACYYTEQVATTEYLRTPATCELYATYYYSCECGNKGYDCFEYGELANCSYGEWNSNNDGTHSKICAYNNSHILTDDCYGDSATCERPAICEACNAEYGSCLPHSFVEEVVEPRYLRTEANCLDAATYYLSCVCGLHDENTGFAHADALGHSWSNGECVRCGEPRVVSKGLEYTLDINYNYSVTGKGTCSDTEIVIPDSHEGRPVVSIGANAFKNHDEITSVDIPDSICEIFEGAFYGCSSLNKIRIPANVNSIGDNAFRDCEKLKSIDFEFGGLREIGSYAFAYCTNLTNVEVPTSVAVINDHAFANCSKLVAIDVGYYVEYIGDEAFYNCENLRHVTLHGGLKYVGKQAFIGCNQLVYNEHANAKYLGAENDPYIYLAQGTGATTEIHSTCRIIGSHTFYNLSMITSVVVPDGVKQIGEYAFYDCTNLTSVKIGRDVEDIGAFAFAGCDKLTTVYFNAVGCGDFEEQDKVFGWAGQEGVGITLTFGEYVSTIPAHFMKDGTGWYVNVVEIVFEHRTVATSIGNRAFEGCKGLRSIEIPNHISDIGEYAFNKCENITSIVIGEGVKNIGTWAFRCENLTEVKFNAVNMNDLTLTSNIFRYANGGDNEIVLTIGAKVQKIPARLFMQSDNLVSIIFEKGSVCENIGNSAFSLCSSLTTIYYCGESNDWNDIAMEDYNDALTDATIYFYSETQPTETTHNYWHYDENNEIVIWDLK